jgi:beta-N-acetylhexosaminidase
MGVNVVYAPSLDVASNPDNAAMGIRSFGDDPAQVAVLGAAMVAGLQRAGVAATIKHFPGLGDAADDTHHGGAVIASPRDRLEAVELPPFRAGIAAGARLVMSSHVAVPALTGDPALPGTLSRAVMTDLLRGEFGFDGVTISDALDMAALDQGAAQRAQMVAAANAGVDLFLCAADRDKLERIEAALEDGAADGAIDAAGSEAALARIHALRRWVGQVATDVGLDVVGGAEHRALEAEVAVRALTLATDPARWRPLDLSRDATIAAIMPTPTDLTPADTSSTIRPGLAAALRVHHPSVEEIVVSPSPTDAEIAAVRARVATVEAVIVGTIDADHQAGQVRLVSALAEAAGDRPLVAVALRTPWDVSTYPADVPGICTYSIHPASLAALADALFGRAGFPGRLPVQVPGAHDGAYPGAGPA